MSRLFIFAFLIAVTTAAVLNEVPGPVERATAAVAVESKPVAEVGDLETAAGHLYHGHGHGYGHGFGYGGGYGYGHGWGWPKYYYGWGWPSYGYGYGGGFGGGLGGGVIYG